MRKCVALGLLHIYPRIYTNVALSTLCLFHMAKYVSEVEEIFRIIKRFIRKYRYAVLISVVILSARSGTTSRMARATEIP